MWKVDVFLRGGLGNQFFQWVYALFLQEMGYSVRLNTSLLRKIKGNQAIGQFELRRVFSDLLIDTCDGFSIGRLEPVVVRIAYWIGRLDRDMLDVKHGRPSRYQYGYYQTNIFAESGIVDKVRGTLRSEFLRPIVDGPYAVLHVRAGDYASNKYNYSQIGRLSHEYYGEVCEWLVRNFPEGKVILVSDDARYLEGLISYLYKGFGSELNLCLLSEILGRPERADDALQAMLGASILSTANSSFSAMAAYLMGGAVVSPLPWFRGDALSKTDPSLENWTRISARFDK